ncbi:MAG TPA: heparin lyase I family protein [Nitrososphaeraceae archaeon]|nr:heparin lyase I family protein [Nitrososphaeraceae archaeon]
MPISLLVLFLPIIVEGMVKSSNTSNTLNQSSISIEYNKTLLSTINFNTTELSSISAIDNLRYQISKILLKHYGVQLGFEEGDINSFWNWNGAEFDKNDINRSHFEVITDSPKEGTKALKFIVHPDDVSNNGARTEVIHYSSNDFTKPILFDDGEEMWFHWYTRIPENTQITNTWHIFTQWHQLPEPNGLPCPAGVTSQWCDAVPLGFNFKNSPQDGGLVFELNVLNHTNANPNGFDNLWRENFVKGEWYEFLLHLIWSKCNNFRFDGKCIDTENKGLIELWVNEDKKFTKTNRYTLDSDSQVYLKVYLKQGLYHGLQNRSQITWTQTIDHDGMEYLSCKTNFPFSWLVC